MKRGWHEINNSAFDIADIKNMCDMALMVASSNCNDYRLDYLNAEKARRKRRKHLVLVE